MCHQNVLRKVCPRLRQKESKFEIFLKGMPQTPLVGTREHAFTRYYHPATILFSPLPPSLKILYETLTVRTIYIVRVPTVDLKSKHKRQLPTLQLQGHFRELKSHYHNLCFTRNY